jgi:osmotically-inducible protein OsmY
VCERLTADAELDAGDVTVVVRDAEVTLDGTVPDRHSKHLAEELSASVSGVRAVHNRLRAQRGLLSELGERLSRD